MTGRPLQSSPLVPRQPTTVLGWTMRELRLAARQTVTWTARQFGCSPSHISRVERGANKPSRALILFYEDVFEADGMLLSLFEVAAHAAEQDRRRAGGRRTHRVRAVPGDSSIFVSETIPHGVVMPPGHRFKKTWRIRNSGSVIWKDRRIERQGPLAGPGLITSPRYAPVPYAEPGDMVDVTVAMKGPTYDGSSIAYFKMVDSAGFLCFPDDYQLGLDVLVRVARSPDAWQHVASNEPVRPVL